jgi:hypothetical protein
LGWPESGQVEFKQDIPGRDGKRDPWHDGKDFAAYGRDKLFKEIVAFANTLGGHLVLGIEETEDKPPTAKAIHPIPRCHDLAERLSRSASQAIDPQIRGLLVRGIEVGTAGSGVVVFRIPESPAAPHRAPDLHAYVRRNTDSTPMSMREIQDITLATRARGERIEARFQEASQKFSVSFGGIIGKTVPVIGYRITAMPTTPLSLPRLFGCQGLVAKSNQFISVLVGEQPLNFEAPSLPQTRALVRGVEFIFATNDRGAACRIYQDGSVEFEFGTALSTELNIIWIIAELIRVAKTVENVRSLGGHPDLEYSVEIEFSNNSLLSNNSPLSKAVVILGWDNGRMVLADVPLTLPRVSYGPKTEIDSFLTQSHTDIFDACGANQHDPIPIKLVGA